jgi:hypothetical protein
MKGTRGIGPFKSNMVQHRKGDMVALGGGTRGTAEPNHGAIGTPPPERLLLVRRDATNYCPGRRGRYERQEPCLVSPLSSFARRLPDSNRVRRGRRIGRSRRHRVREGRSRRPCRHSGRGAGWRRGRYASRRRRGGRPRLGRIGGIGWSGGSRRVGRRCGLRWTGRNGWRHGHRRCVWRSWERNDLRDEATHVFWFVRRQHFGSDLRDALRRLHSARWRHADM